MKTNLDFAGTLEVMTAYSGVPLKGDAVLLAAESIINLRKNINVWGEARNKLISQFSNGKDSISHEDAVWSEFKAECEKLERQKVEVDLNKLKLSDWDKDRKTEQNHIAILLHHGLLEK